MRKSDTHTVYHQTAELECFGRRRVVTAIDGGPMTSDAGARLLPQFDRTLSPFDQVAVCFSHRRNPDRIQRALRTRIAQPIVGVALGHEYLNDHDQLRHDPLMALFSRTPRCWGRRPRAGLGETSGFLNSLKKNDLKVEGWFTTLDLIGSDCIGRREDLNQYLSARHARADLTSARGCLAASALVELAGEAAPNLIPQKVRGVALLPKPSCLNFRPCLWASVPFYRANRAES